MKTTIVTTTINIPVLLLKYAENAQRYGHKELDFVVIAIEKALLRPPISVSPSPLPVRVPGYSGPAGIPRPVPGTVGAPADRFGPEAQHRHATGI